MASTRRIGSVIARWTIELAVVFVGVYGAFALSEWEEDRERAQRAAQVRTALIEEIRGIQYNTRNAALTIQGMVARMDTAMRAGTTPPLQPMMEAIGFRTHVWDATMASGELGLLDVETFYDVSEFYNELNAGFMQLEQLRELSQSMLLPALDQPAASFYEPTGSGAALRLRPQWRWYLYGIGRTGRIARCVTVMGDSVLLRLGAEPDTTAPRMTADEC